MLFETRQIWTREDECTCWFLQYYMYHCVICIRVCSHFHHHLPSLILNIWFYVSPDSFFSRLLSVLFHLIVSNITSTTHHHFSEWPVHLPPHYFALISVAVNCSLHFFLLPTIPLSSSPFLVAVSVAQSSSVCLLLCLSLCVCHRLWMIWRRGWRRQGLKSVFVRAS